ncbi:hypothetical protein OIU77_001327 [Salix suchowensis]|uniref:Eukaryotic translation initiation factor 3 30 kDa subunit n=1 Tax=Salix suchowensis TaxID=1278906 RepID=A0ABQ9B124_9ROSI|nr:hypothetical protein OIU77_001327 [Salix suchowensis]
MSFDHISPWYMRKKDKPVKLIKNSVDVCWLHRLRAVFWKCFSKLHEKKDKAVKLPKEDVQIQPLLSKEQPRNKWDDEYVDEDDVKESWEDEDEPAPAPVVKPLPEKAPKKSTEKTTEKKGKTVEVVKEEKQDALAEKLRQQRLVEEADFRSTTELFAKKGDEKSLDSFIPKSENDFLEYAELISHKLRSFEVC